MPSSPAWVHPSSSPAGSSASCGDVTAPTDDASKHDGNDAADAGKQISLYNEVAAVAFMCGTSRIAGVCHAGDLLFPGTMPDLYLSAFTDIRSFADRCRAEPRG